MSNKIVFEATGETITFTKTSDDTTGKIVETIVTLPASGEGPPSHRHVLQTELFEAIDGRLGLDCGDKKVVLDPGESFMVPANTLHRCYSVDGAETKFKATFTPGLNIQYILTEIFESSNRRNSKIPSVFDACYILRQVKGEYYLGDVPVFIQQYVFPLIAGVGKFFGLVRAKPKTA